MKTFHLTVTITAPTREDADDLRGEIVGAVEDAHERGDAADGDVGDLEIGPPAV